MKLQIKNLDMVPDFLEEMCEHGEPDQLFIDAKDGTVHLNVSDSYVWYILRSIRDELRREPNNDLTNDQTLKASGEEDRNLHTVTVASRRRRKHEN